MPPHFDKVCGYYVVLLCYSLTRGGDYMGPRKRRRKNTKHSFKFLHSILIVCKYFLKIAKVLKEIIDLFR